MIEIWKKKKIFKLTGIGYFKNVWPIETLYELTLYELILMQFSYLIQIKQWKLES